MAWHLRGGHTIVKWHHIGCVCDIIFTVTSKEKELVLRESHVAQAGLQLDTAKDGLALLLFLPVSQARDGSCVPLNLVSVVLEWNSGFMQLGELCPLSGRASPVIFFFPFGLVLL